MQALELEAGRVVGSHLQDGGNGQGVVGGELRVEPRPAVEQRAGADEVGQVGGGLARIDRKAVEPALLRVLDLRVPVGALDEPHHHAEAALGGQRVDVLDHRERPLPVGLHREAEAVPAGEVGLAGHRVDHVERQFQPLGLFRVDGEVEIVALRPHREVANDRHQLGEDALAVGRRVARVERRQLHRNARTVGQRLVTGAPADGLDRVGVGFQVAPSVVGGAGALAQHVVGMAVALLLQRAGALQRVGDGLAEYEMAAEEAHGLARRMPHRRRADPLHQRRQDARRRFARPDDAGRQAERPGGGCGQHPVLVALARRPAAGADLVLDQPVLRFGVRHAQERLGQHHQRQPFARRQAELAQEVLDAADAAASLADALDEAARRLVDGRLVVRPAVRLAQERGNGLFVGGREGCGEGGDGHRRVSFEGRLRPPAP